MHFKQGIQRKEGGPRAWNSACQRATASPWLARCSPDNTGTATAMVSAVVTPSAWLNWSKSWQSVSAWWFEKSLVAVAGAWPQASMVDCTIPSAAGWIAGGCTRRCHKPMLCVHSKTRTIRQAGTIRVRERLCRSAVLRAKFTEGSLQESCAGHLLWRATLESARPCLK